MPSWDQTNAHCHVIAWKEGLLSAVGHNVKVELRKFRIEFDGDRVTGTFDARSAASVCAVRDGRDDPNALSAKDRATIDGYLQNDILESRRHAEVRFTSTRVELSGGEGEIEGDLTLRGRTRSITLAVTSTGGATVARVRLHQPDFGIAPFRAMLGALRIQPTIDVELSVPPLAG